MPQVSIPPKISLKQFFSTYINEKILIQRLNKLRPLIIPNDARTILTLNNPIAISSNTFSRLKLMSYAETQPQFILT